MMPDRSDSRRCAAACLLLLALGCDSDSVDSADASIADAAVEPDAGRVADPSFVARPIGELTEGFNKLDPGGQTSCSRGTPFSFYVRRGSVNRVVIEFRGGGACWDAETCRPGAISPSGYPWFIDDADPGFPVLSEAWGIYDHSNPDNPVKDWHHLFIPYCTGDLHQGNEETNYGDFTLHHKGAVNARAALEWLYEALPNPEKVLVTGCSAGGAASINWVAHVRRHYRKAIVSQFADGASGVWADEPMLLWNSIEALPTFVPGIDMNTLHQPDFLAAIGKYFPDVLLSSFVTAYDETQADYFTAISGHDVRAWSERVRANLRETEARTPNFRSFLAPDYRHCVINYPEFYTLRSNGVRVVDFLRDIVDGKRPDSVSCEPNCGSPSPADSR